MVMALDPTPAQQGGDQHGFVSVGYQRRGRGRPQPGKASALHESCATLYSCNDVETQMPCCNEDVWVKAAGCISEICDSLVAKELATSLAPIPQAAMKEVKEPMTMSHT